MKKRVLSLIAVVLICFNCMVLPVMAASAIEVIGNILTLKDFCDVLIELSEPFKAQLSQKYEIGRQQCLAFWNEIIVRGQMSEENFRAWYTEVLNCSGNSAYYDIPLTDEQWAVVNAYYFVMESVCYRITLDDICDFCFNNNGEAVDNPDTSVNSYGYVQISGKTFSEICAQLREQYSPDDHGNHKVLSWRTDTYLNCIKNYGNMLGFFQSGTFCNSSWNEVYLVPFYYDGSQYYYSSYQLHFYQTMNNEVLTMASTYWNMRENTAVSDPYLYTNRPLTDYRYMGIGWFNTSNGYCLDNSPPLLVFHKTYDDYIAYSGTSNNYSFDGKSYTN